MSSKKAKRQDKQQITERKLDLGALIPKDKNYKFLAPFHYTFAT